MGVYEVEIYDKAHELAASIQDCKEYKELVEAGKALAQDEKTMRLVREFLLWQTQLAYAQSMGDKPIRKKIEQLNRLSELVKANPTAVEYLTKYNAWQALAGEVFQIIQQSMAEGMSILDQ